MRTLREYLYRYGRPVLLYSDRQSIFRVNRPDRDGELTQFTRALEALRIQTIHVHSLQAKGCVPTLQERLTRELRLRGIDDMEAANSVAAGVSGGIQPALREGVARGAGRAQGDGAGGCGTGPDPVSASRADCCRRT